MLVLVVGVLAGCRTIDGDGDGFGTAVDCDDSDAAVNPDADELCDGIDNNCDNTIDEDAADAGVWFLDSDGDSFGDASAATTACEQPDGTTADRSDCDDTNAAVSPDADELCDSIDNDCDGTIDEDDAVDAATFYIDSDGDGYGDVTTPAAACDQPTGFVADATDCDDGDAASYPGATETCDDADNDCDGTVDEDVTTTFYEDGDGDGYGDATSSTEACSQPSGYVTDSTDCDDSEEAANPGESEVCDGLDNDCSGVVDDNTTDAETVYADSDGDGYGDADSAATACEVPSGYSEDDTDCDDTDSEVNPEMLEDCTDGIDNNCDGATDDICMTGTADADAALTGSDSTGYLGYYGLHTSGDLNGDGYADLTVGVAQAGSLNEGAVYVVSGPLSSGTSLTTGSDASATITGADSSDNLGYVLDVGDVNGDGYDDLVSSAPSAEDSASTVTGGVFVFYGPLTGSITATDADLSFWGEDRFDSYGRYVVAAYDYDSDGAAEVITGSTVADLSGTRLGVIAIHSGGSDGDTYSEAQTRFIGNLTDSEVGSAFDEPGDLDGDGLNDLLIGAYGNDAAYVVYGSTTGDLYPSDADVTFSESARTFTGTTVGSGDLNDDGYIDVLIGAYAGGSGSGHICLFYGPVSGSYRLDDDHSAEINPDSSSENLGRYDGADTTGDVDGDGSDDLFIGSYRNETRSTDAGGAFLFYGPLSGSMVLSEADLLVLGDASDSLGTRVSAGDLSGDGTLDITTVSFRAASEAGQTYTFFGEGF